MTAQKIADLMLTLIDGDIAAGQVPAGVGSYEELHSFVDANEYAVEAETRFGIDTARDGFDTINAATNLVDARLRARADA